MQMQKQENSDENSAANTSYERSNQFMQIPETYKNPVIICRYCRCLLTYKTFMVKYIEEVAVF